MSAMSVDSGTTVAELKEVLARLQEIDASSLCDTDKAMRVLDPGIARINPGPRLVGTAFTVRCVRGDFFAVADAVERAEPGDVLVIDTQDSPAAVMGELMATEALRKGIAGFVVDGLARDVAALRALPLPVYARGSRPNSGTARQQGELGVRVRCGGVDIVPGDILVGDDDGVAVVTLEQVAPLLDAAEAVQVRERAVLGGMREGRSLFDSLDLSGVRDGTATGTRWRPLP